MDSIGTLYLIDITTQSQPYSFYFQFILFPLWTPTLIFSFQALHKITLLYLLFFFRLLHTLIIGFRSNNSPHYSLSFIFIHTSHFYFLLLLFFLLLLLIFSFCKSIHTSFIRESYNQVKPLPCMFLKGLQIILLCDRAN